jgi:phosphate uptake regulator
MKESNIRKLESISERLEKEAERLFGVAERELFTLEKKDISYIGEAYKDIVYISKALGRIAKVAREDADDEV